MEERIRCVAVDLAKQGWRLHTVTLPPEPYNTMELYAMGRRDKSATIDASGLVFVILGYEVRMLLNASHPERFAAEFACSSFTEPVHLETFYQDIGA